MIAWFHDPTPVTQGDINSLFVLAAFILAGIIYICSVVEANAKRWVKELRIELKGK